MALTRINKESEMKDNHRYSMIISTCADRESAKEIAGLLVKRRLAACVQLFPIESIYVWEDEVKSGAEIALLIKSKASLFDKIAALIRENHEYEVPEIISVPITDGLPEYLKWIDDIASPII